MVWPWNGDGDDADKVMTIYTTMIAQKQQLCAAAPAAAGGQQQLLAAASVVTAATSRPTFGLKNRSDDPWGGSTIGPVDEGCCCGGGGGGGDAASGREVHKQRRQLRTVGAREPLLQLPQTRGCESRGWSTRV